MTQDNENTAVVAASPQAPAKWEESGVDLETVGLARAMVASGYFKNIESVGQAITKIKLGQSIGLEPVEALQYLHIFNSGEGKYERTNIVLGYPAVGAKIQRSGRYHFAVKAQTDAVCEIEFYRILGGGELRSLGVSRFTIEQATRAGLVSRGGDRGPWRTYPETMLYARALTNGAKRFCPEVLAGAGVYTEEPYIEGEARTVEPETVEVEARVVVVEGDEGKSPWAWFWTGAKDAGYDKETVHRFAGVGPAEGELAAWAKGEAVRLETTVADVLGKLLADLRAHREVSQDTDTPNAEAIYEREGLPVE